MDFNNGYIKLNIELTKFSKCYYWDLVDFVILYQRKIKINIKYTFLYSSLFIKIIWYYSYIKIIWYYSYICKITNSKASDWL